MEMQMRSLPHEFSFPQGNVTLVNCFCPPENASLMVPLLPIITTGFQRKKVHMQTQRLEDKHASSADAQGSKEGKASDCVNRQNNLLASFNATYGSIDNKKGGITAR